MNRSTDQIAQGKGPFRGHRFKLTNRGPYIKRDNWKGALRFVYKYFIPPGRRDLRF